MKMIQSRISNVPFLDGANGMYRTTNKSHFKVVDNTAVQKRDIILQPVSAHLQRGDHNDLGMYQTETALSFPSHSPVHVFQPMLTHLTMQSTNIKMHSGNSCGDFETTQSDFKTLPMSAAPLIRPTTAVRIALPGSKCPETTYRSSYTKHEVSPVLRTQETLNTGSLLHTHRPLTFCILWVDRRCFLFINKVSDQVWTRTKRTNSAPVIMSSSSTDGVLLLLLLSPLRRYFLSFAVASESVS